IAGRNEQLSRLLDWLDAQPGVSEAPPSPAASYLKQVSIPYRDKILIIPVNRLLSAEVSDGVTRLYVTEEATPTAQLRGHIVSHTLDQLEANLDPELFFRVHRSAIV